MNDAKNLVSVIIPVFNGERFLSRTLGSVLAQTYNPLEIIIIDDGSTDYTGELVEAVSAHDYRIRFFRTKNSGAAAARNFGIGQSRGELLAPLDADDLWHPEKIAHQVKVMRRSAPTVGVVYCWSILIDEDDFIIELAGPRCTFQGWVTAELLKSNFLRNSSSPLIKRSCIEAVGGYDTGLRPQGAVDWKLYLALSEFCEFAFVPECLVGYRKWTGAMSRDVANMAKSIELVGLWAAEKWSNFPAEFWRERAYGLNLYLAREALENKQYLEAVRYRAIGYKARPAAFFERSNFQFMARVVSQVARLNWIRRPKAEGSFPTFPSVGQAMSVGQQSSKRGLSR